MEKQVLALLGWPARQQQVHTQQLPPPKSQPCTGTAECVCPSLGWVDVVTTAKLTGAGKACGEPQKPEFQALTDTSEDAE